MTGANDPDRLPEIPDELLQRLRAAREQFAGLEQVRRDLDALLALFESERAPRVSEVAAVQIVSPSFVGAGGWPASASGVSHSEGSADAVLIKGDAGAINEREERWLRRVEAYGPTVLQVVNFIWRVVGGG